MKKPVKHPVLRVIRLIVAAIVGGVIGGVFFTNATNCFAFNCNNVYLGATIGGSFVAVIIGYIIGGGYGSAFAVIVEFLLLFLPRLL
jgi:hypothetical protein